jgi:hypothetical protein
VAGTENDRWYEWPLPPLTVTVIFASANAPPDVAPPVVSARAGEAPRPASATAARDIATPVTSAFVDRRIAPTP